MALIDSTVFKDLIVHGKHSLKGNSFISHARSSVFESGGGRDSSKINLEIKKKYFFYGKKKTIFIIH